jgi:hypothetical protein
MSYLYCLILLLIPLTFAYPHSYSNDFDRLLKKYLKEQSGNINDFNSPNLNEEFFVRQQRMFPMLPIQQHQPLLPPMCLPNVWTCGPGLPPCCPGLMCYDGNAKRGRHCVARG